MFLQNSQRKIEEEFLKLTEKLGADREPLKTICEKLDGCGRELGLAMKYLYVTAPYSDLVNYSFEELQDFASHGLFLYNTLEGIRAEALIAGVDSIAEMTEALATYFRYTISQVNNLVTLEEELANVENYYYIQQFRFGSKLDLRIRYDCEDEEEALMCQLPKLTLQPIVENSIYHGLERKIGTGHLDIKVTVTDSHLIIMISDDGVGIEKGQVKVMNEQLRALRLEEENNGETGKKGGIAVKNVNNRIKLLFGEEYGIYIYSQPDVGTDVEITLPVVRN